MKSIKMSTVLAYEEFEYCWHTGDYTDQICEFCPYRSQCSGGNEDEN